METMKQGIDFEKDLVHLSGRLADDEQFAQHVYAALCNVDWQPLGGEHTSECMLVSGQLPDRVKKNVVITTMVDGELVRRPPDPWCTCGLAYSCSWRYAGGLVASLRNRGEDYMAFYCSGGEGHVTDDAREALRVLGWEPRREGGRHLISINADALHGGDA